MKKITLVGRAIEHGNSEHNTEGIHDSKVFNYHKNLLTLALRERKLIIRPKTAEQIEHIARIEQALHDLNAYHGLTKETQIKLLQHNTDYPAVRSRVRENLENASRELHEYMERRIEEPEIGNSYFHSTFTQLAARKEVQENQRRRDDTPDLALQVLATLPLTNKVAEFSPKSTYSTVHAIEIIEDPQKFAKHKQKLLQTLIRLKKSTKIEKEHPELLKEEDLKIMLATAITNFHENYDKPETINQIINTEITKEHDLNKIERQIQQSLRRT